MTRDLKLIYGAMFFIGFGFGLYFPLYPLYAQQLGANSVQIGILYTVFFFWTAAVAIPGGLLADRYELRKIIVWVWVVGIPAGIVFYLSQNWYTLILGDFLGGISMLNGPALAVYVMKRSPREKLNSAFSLVYSSFSVGMIVSPSLGGYLAEIWGIRNIFLLTTFFYTLSTLLIIFITREYPAAFEKREGEKKAFSLFQNRRFVYFLLYFSAIFFIFSIAQPFFSPFLRNIKGYSFTQIGTLAAMTSLGAAFLGPIMGQVGDRLGKKVALAGGIFLFIFGLLSLLQSKSILIIALAFLFFGIIEGVRSLATATVSEMVEILPAGLAFGLFRMVTTGASFLGPYLGGWLYALSSPFPFMVSAFFLGTILILTALLKL